MKMRSTILSLLFVCAWTSTLWGQECASSQDKTLSPYFFVLSETSEVDQLPLKSTDVSVHISGVIADVSVVQKYVNRGSRPIEAIYIFPASTRAAVYGMTLFVGDRKIQAKVKERGEARETYEEAKKEGKSASLLEEQRPNVFQMNVANIMPGDELAVELKYTELLVPTEGIYEFVYPTVVGPRYTELTEDTAPASEHWIRSPYLQENELPASTFDIHVALSTGMKIQDVQCSSHQIKASFDGPSFCAISLEASENYGGNRDYILRYRMADRKIETGLLLYEGEKENFFLLMAQPPQRVVPSSIPPREYIFIVDVSGSMNGFPLNTSKEVLRKLLAGLRPQDSFNVLLFSGATELLSSQSLQATSANLQKAMRVIDSKRGGGGTRLLLALKKAMSLPKEENGARTIVIVTDGYVSVEKEAFDLIRENLNQSNFFAFGIGSSVNRYLIEGMARAGNGEPFVVTDPAFAAEQVDRFEQYIASPVLTGIEASYEGFDAYDVEPLSLPDLFAERPLLLFGKWRGKAKGRILLSGTTGKGPYEERVSVKQDLCREEHGALAYLWARSRIATLCDYSQVAGESEVEKEVTSLGLTYNLLTPYTSFVAVDEVVRNQSGSSTPVKQPLPLPQGVSNKAVGGGGVPEPTTSALLLLGGGILARKLRRRRREGDHRDGGEEA